MGGVRGRTEQRKERAVRAGGSNGASVIRLVQCIHQMSAHQGNPTWIALNAPRARNHAGRSPSHWSIGVKNTCSMDADWPVHSAIFS